VLSLAEVPACPTDRGQQPSRSIMDGYVLKHENGSGAVAHEAEVYRALAGQPGMRPHLPPHHSFDAAAGALTVRHPPGAVDLDSHHETRRRPSVAVAAALGRLLASLHNLPSTLLPPGQSPASHGEVDRANLDLARIIQGTKGFAERLDAAAATWSSVAPTHQDLKPDKILVRGGRPRVTLVGWERAGAGDPRWDTGSVLACYLTLWISSVPDWSLVAQRPIDSVTPAIRACWQAYATAMGMKGEAAQLFLESTLPLVAVRLVRTALEAARASHRPTTGQLLHLRVAQNILERPHEAMARLGLTAGSDRRPA
jgi:aminoglycoside phosphotransferase (APT) family kinase protein